MQKGISLHKVYAPL